MEWMFMPFKRYADFSGRSRRMEFWMWILFQVIVYVVVVILAMVLGGGAMMMMGSGADPTSAMAAGGAMMIIFLLYGLFGLVCLIPSIAVSIRRLHDTDRTGWWLMAFWGPYLVLLASPFIVGASVASGSDPMAGGVIALIAVLALLVGSLILLVFDVLEGTKGPNQYGPDPKAPDASQVFS